MNPVYLFFFTKVASTEGFLIATGLILLYLAFRRRTKEALLFFLTTIGVVLSTNTLKLALHIARPENPLIQVTGYAFPSGHASGSAFLALSVCYLIRNARKPLRYVSSVAVIGAALAIGWSRIYLGVHTPLQVAAGFALGAVWACIFIWMNKRGR